MQNNNRSELELFYIESKQFYSFFSQLKSSESIIVVNTQTNNIFKHLIILNNKTVSFITVFTSYVFNLLTDLQYNNIEFKGLFINSNILT